MTNPVCASGTKALAVFLLLAALGCSSEPTATVAGQTAPATGVTAAGVEPSATPEVGTSVSTSVSTSAMQRVIVTLQPITANPANVEAGKDSMDQVMQRLVGAFPDAKVVRTMPGFSQMVIDLPADQLKVLSADPRVASAKLEARYSTMPIDKVPQER